MIKVGDLVEPKPGYLGQIGKVTATLHKHATRWLFINGSMLPAFKYRPLQQTQTHPGRCGLVATLAAVVDAVVA